MEKINVHPRINQRHSNLTDSDVTDAWSNIIHSRTRIEEEPFECVAVGVDGNGRLIEMVAVRIENGSTLIFHAMTPPTKKTLRELNLSGARRAQ